MGIRGLILFFLVLAACTSAEKRAEQYMEGGAYQEAASTYEEILRRDPKNAEAVLGLAKARAMLIDRSLIEIRKARISGNPSDATALLLDLMGREKTWNLRPSGAAVFTQQEETQYATTYAVVVLKNAISGRYPLKTETLLRTYEPLFQEVRTKEFNDLKAQNQKLGQTECRKFAKENYRKKPYLAELVQRYCGFWGENIDLTSLSGYDERDKNIGLVKEVKFSGSISQLPPEMMSELVTRANRSLKETPWYLAQGEIVLDLGISGEWSQDQQKNQIQLVHEYQETESYVEYEDVVKERQIPYEAMVTTPDPKTGVLTPSKVIKYRSEYYKEKEPREKKRQILKTFPYGAWKIDQNLKVSLSGDTTLIGRSLKVALSDQNHSSDTSSEVNMPSIGLRPKAATAIPDKTQWLRSKIDEFGKRLSGSLSSLWSDLYCTDLTVGQFSTGNQASQCLRLTSGAPNVPKAVDDWYLKHFGVGAGVVNNLIRAP